MTIKKLGLCLCAAVFISLAFVACDKTETVEQTIYVPAITVSTAMVNAAVEGGGYGFSYVVSNAAEDGAVALQTDAAWISGVTDTGTEVSFTVEENTSAVLRTCKITLTYSSSYGSIAKTVTVAQASGADPELSVSPTAVTTEFEGGTCSFAYILANEAADGELSCSTDADWSGGVDFSDYGTVSFTVAVNEEYNIREAEIAVSYVYGNGVLSESVTVVQDHHLGGNESIEDLIGTYSASGYTYYDSAQAVETTWTLKIYESTASGYDVLIDGLVPAAAGYYPGTSAYIAQASFTNGKIVIPAQVSGYYVTISGVNYMLGWYPCSSFSEDKGWHRSGDITDCTFTFSNSTGKWTSDYGMFGGYFTYGYGASSSSFKGFYDVANPGIVLTKISRSTDSASLTSHDAGRQDGNPVFHTEDVLSE